MSTSDKAKPTTTWAAREVDGLLHRFARYTRFVLYSKWFLGILALGLLTSLIALPLLTKDRSGMRMSFIDTGAVSPGKAAQPVMKNPEFRGANAAGEPFKVAGLRGVQLTPTLSVIEQVEGQILRKDGKWLSLMADRAEYQQDSKKIQLIGNVTVIDDAGYSLTTPSATIDTKTNNAFSNELVSGTGPLGNLLASGFKISDKGKHIAFTSNAEQRVILHIDRPNKQR